MRRRGKGGALKFWLGAGMGMLLSAVAVAITAEFTYLRRQRFLRTGMLDSGEETLVQDLSEAVAHGLETISHAARELGHTFADARRELVRLGLEPNTGAGQDSAGWYYDEEDAPQRKQASEYEPEYGV